MHLLAHGLTDIGNKRTNNEDALILWHIGPPALSPLPSSSALDTDITGNGVLLAVSDGVGGHNAGEVASALAIATLHAQLRQPAATDAPAARLRAAIDETEKVICRESTLDPARANMAATLTALWLRADGAWLGQIGDSRLYRYRDGGLKQLSPEHSPVGRMRLAGELTEEEARNHRFKNVIDQSLGGNLDPDSFKPDILPLDLHAGDHVLICSDGLSDGLPDARLAANLAELAAARATPADTAAALVNEAKQASGRDNITAIVARLS